MDGDGGKVFLPVNSLCCKFFFFFYLRDGNLFFWFSLFLVFFSFSGCFVSLQLANIETKTPTFEIITQSADATCSVKWSSNKQQIHWIQKKQQQQQKHTQKQLKLSFQFSFADDLFINTATRNTQNKQSMRNQ